MTCARPIVRAVNPEVLTETQARTAVYNGIPFVIAGLPSSSKSVGLVPSNSAVESASC